MVTACSTAPAPPRSVTPSAAPPSASVPSKRGGGYYLDDGPGDAPPADLAFLPDAEPRAEPLHRFANNPYVVFGRSYTPERELRPLRMRGVGSWYGRKFHGQKTASGEIYDMYAMTAAHPTLPIPSYARVTNLANGRSVVVRVNDRGPFLHERVIDLSYAAAWKLGYAEQGSATVEVETIVVDRTLLAAAPSQWPERPAAKPAPAPPASGMPLETEPTGVFIQLGAFSARENAENFRARLALEAAALDRPAEVYRRDGFFRLHVGPYRSRAEAAAAAAQLRELLDVAPQIVVR
jgi:rare lipoprotein A